MITELDKVIFVRTNRHWSIVVREALIYKSYVITWNDLIISHMHKGALQVSPTLWNFTLATLLLWRPILINICIHYCKRSNGDFCFYQKKKKSVIMLPICCAEIYCYIWDKTAANFKPSSWNKKWTIKTADNLLSIELNIPYDCISFLIKTKF